MAKMKCMTCGNLFTVKGKHVPPCPHCQKPKLKEKPKYVKRTPNNR